MTDDPVPCGTRTAYTRGCRCDDCRTANNAYHRDRRSGPPTCTGTIETTLPPIEPAGAWTGRAACAGLPADLFFPGRGAPRLVRTVCGACPVRVECLEWAVANRIDHGWWGGEPPRTRRQIRLAAET